MHQPEQEEAQPALKAVQDDEKNANARRNY